MFASFHLRVLSKFLGLCAASNGTIVVKFEEFVRKPPWSIPRYYFSSKLGMSEAEANFS